MAKAKKTTTDSSKPTRPKAARKAPARKPPRTEQAGSTPATPLIDTSSAAQAAAAMIAHRNKLQKSPAESESGLVNQLKQQLNRPASQVLGGLAGGSAEQKKSNLPLAGGRQLGLLQKGGGYNRTGVPRRTAG